MIKTLFVLFCTLILVPLFFPTWLLGCISSFAIGTFQSGFGTRDTFVKWIGK